MRWLCISVFFLPAMSFGDTLCVPDDYETIQEALDEAEHNDVIEIAAGEFEADVDDGVAELEGFMRLTIKGVPGETTIDGRIKLTLDLGVTLQGLILTDARVESFLVDISDCEFQESLPTRGLRVSTTSPNGEAIIRDCTFSSYDGVRCSFATAYVEDCVFDGCKLALRAGGEGGTVHAEKCEFYNCETVIKTHTWDDPEDSTITNSLMVDCDVWAVSQSTGVNRLDHCTIIGMGHLMAVEDGAIEVRNSIIWGHEDPFTLPNGNELIGEDATILIEYTCFEDGHEGKGNIEDEPDFVDADEGDYSLAKGSPCLGAAEDGLDLGALWWDQSFMRGDVDGNGRFVILGDVLFLLQYRFVGGKSPPCLDAADADDNGDVTGMLDSLYLLDWFFYDGPEPLGWKCDIDLTPDDLGCEVGVCE